jgi:hypothetical protein
VQLTDSKTDTQHSKNCSKFLSLNKMTILRIYIAIIWFTTALILLTTTEMASYEDVKYFFWTVSVLVPLFYVLYMKGVTDQLSKEQEKEHKKAIFVLAFSFACLIMAFFTAILIKY